MKLLFNDASPYARKCLVTAIEKGLEDRVDVDRINAWETDIRDVNPLGKIPCLVLDDGAGLFDSFPICDYLDSIGDGPKLIPDSGAARVEVLKMHAAGQGMTDAALTLRAQVMRDAKLDTPLPKDFFIDRQWDAIHHVCRYLDGRVDALAGEVDLGKISIGTALGYLDLRFPGAAWRHHGPALAKWYEGFVQRPSMQKTIPTG